MDVVGATQRNRAFLSRAFFAFLAGCGTWMYGWMQQHANKEWMQQHANKEWMQQHANKEWMQQHASQEWMQLFSTCVYAGTQQPKRLLDFIW
jgi:hypothetical protein